MTSATLYAWRRKFNESGPAGLMGHRRGCKGSRLPEPIKRAIVMMKDVPPDWGQDRIHDMLIRTEGIQASPGAVQRVLREAGYLEQARAENAFFRYKTIIGDRLRARSEPGRKVEARIACDVLNRLAGPGGPEWIAIGP